MSLLLESIKLKDGIFHNLFYHEQRMKRSLHTLCGTDENINLERFLESVNFPKEGLYKCRVVYDDQTTQVEFVPYQTKQITSLRVVEHDRINYEFKYTNRKTIEKLFELRDHCDDILIVKKGIVTDTSYCNIVFRKGDRWFTPWSPLLKGTMRQNLLEHNKIQQEEITLKDIRSFESFKLINAMLEFDGPEVDVSQIVF